MGKEQACKIRMLMSLLEKVSPGISPRHLSRKIDANEPEKICPQASTATNVTRRSANVD
jgi:hypothetical protein